MKVIDIIFALICGRVVGFLIGGFLQEWGIHIGLYYTILLWIILPFFTLFCLWLANLIGKTWLFVFQGAKFALVGAVATVADLTIFEFLLWVLGTIVNPIVSKALSFVVSTALKYWGNKYWTFQKHEKEDMHKEILHFFAITAIGLIIDVSCFYYITSIMGPQFGASVVIWTKLSVIFAALAAALWNFLGYKFLVFKK